MLKKFIFLILLSFATLLPATEVSEQDKARGYSSLSVVQPTQDKNKVEVIEFFWYGCPHCYQFEPLLNEWLKTKPKNVTFIRQPAAFSEQWARHAKAYYVAEALNVVDKVHADFFDAIQNKQQKLESETDVVDFFVAHGVKKSAAEDAYKSFGVDTKLRQATAMAPRYGITGVPTLVINGKYVTSGSIAGSHENMIKVLNQLVAQESNSGKATKTAPKK
jgi:thiol:disulfide interchange protein DsbA